MHLGVAGTIGSWSLLEGNTLLEVCPQRGIGKWLLSLLYSWLPSFQEQRRFLFLPGGTVQLQAKRMWDQVTTDSETMSQNQNKEQPPPQLSSLKAASCVCYSYRKLTNTLRLLGWDVVTRVCIRTRLSLSCLQSAFLYSFVSFILLKTYYLIISIMWSYHLSYYWSFC